MVTIQKATKSDVRGIQEVYYKTFLQIYPNEKLGVTNEDIEKFFEDVFTAESIKNRETQIDKADENTLFLVAKDSENVIGLCVALIKKEYNQLQSIYVLPEYQGKGVGKLFWNEALKFFDKNKDIIVHVATYNEQAIKFYESLGFIDTGKRFTEERHKMPVSGVLIPEMEMVIKK